MDDIGIPIYQAVRPLSRSLSVSQGKGVTPMHSRVSAVMESLEVYHAEDPRLPVIRSSSDNLVADLTYQPSDLHLREPSLFHGAMVLDWMPATVLGGGTATFVPAAVVDMDTTVDGSARPVVFHRDSNGLASGNSRSEAIAHALYEIVERECHAVARDIGQAGLRRIDPASVTGDGGDLVAQFSGANATLQIHDVTSDLAVPCFQVRVWSPSYPVMCFGAGCHADPQVAICRALTEAAQSRVTVISGMREDIEGNVWSFLQRHTVREPHVHHSEQAANFEDMVGPWVSDSIDEDVARLGELVADHTGTRPLVVDLTREDLGIPVVKVLCPGMRLYMP